MRPSDMKLGYQGAKMKLSVEVTGIQEQQLSEAARRLNVPEEELAIPHVRRGSGCARVAAVAGIMVLFE